MHILLVHQAFVTLDEPGGTRHYELAEVLTKRGHHVTIITSSVSYLTGKKSFSSLTSKKNQPNNRITIKRTYTYPALHRSFLHRTFSFISFMVSSFLAGLFVRNVDVVWGTSPPIFQGLTALILARLKRVPLLFEVRDLWPAFAVEIGVLKSPVLIRISEWLEKFLYKQSQLIIVNSPGFIDHVKARGGSQVKLVPNGTDPSMFDPNSKGTDFRKLHDLTEKYIVLYAGAHGISNNLDVLLKAANDLRNLSEIAIVLLGDGKEKLKLQNMAHSMQLSNVHFVSPLPKSEISAALAAADACLAILKPLPLYRSVYPNKVFDYMAACKPVILAIDGVIREVIEKANAGIFVTPGNPNAITEAIKTLADNPRMGESMGLRGRQYVERHFNRATIAEELAELFEKLGKN
jgi:glycosyltransferase involved in cell wall biosynthesis